MMMFKGPDNMLDEMSQKLRRGFGMATSWLRVLPDFVIIGAQRSGTTSLFKYLSAHPDIYPAVFKEVHFFDRFFNRGVSWYRSFFPLALQHRYVTHVQERAFLTGEATPYYLFHPHAAERMAGLLPHVKLIVILRNPVDRAYSQYYHEVKRGLESVSFDEALHRERKILNIEQETLEADPAYHSALHQNHAYLARGRYVEQLQVWRRHFPREQLLVLQSEAFYSDPTAVVARVVSFLGLPPFRLGELTKYNEIQYPDMSAEVRADLQNYFRPYNQQLYEFLGVDWTWEPQAR
jgi:hypothetical protein